MKKYLFLLTVLLLMAAGQSCSSDEEKDNVEPVPVEEKEVIETPFNPNLSVVIPLTSNEKNMVSNLNQFSFDFFVRCCLFKGELLTDSTSMMSPLSLAYAMGMMQAGAKGQTRDEIVTSMYLPAFKAEDINAFFAKMTEWLPQVDTTATLKVANALFINSDLDLKLRDEYVGPMEKDYNAFITGIPYSDPASVDVVNRWCSENTDGLIPSIINHLNRNDILHILNAIYLSAEWKTPFKEELTTMMPFWGEDKGCTVPMMHQLSPMGYASHDTYDAISMPLKGENLRFVVLLPHEKIEDLILELTNNRMKEALTFKAMHNVNLSLPSFEQEATHDLVAELKKAGVTAAFNPAQADFTTMTEQRDVFVSSVLQKTAISVKESGVKAAAVTDVSFGDTSDNSHQEYKEFNANHSFIYCITEQSTGLILFIGCYAGD